MGRVMTEEEYEEWKKEKEGGRQREDDTGIDWGMGEGQYSVFGKKEDHLIISGQHVSLFPVDMNFFFFFFFCHASIFHYFLF